MRGRIRERRVCCFPVVISSDGPTGSYPRVGAVADPVVLNQPQTVHICYFRGGWWEGANLGTAVMVSPVYSLFKPQSQC